LNVSINGLRVDETDLVNEHEIDLLFIDRTSETFK